MLTKLFSVLSLFVTGSALAQSGVTVNEMLIKNIYQCSTSGSGSREWKFQLKFLANRIEGKQIITLKAQYDGEFTGESAELINATANSSAHVDLINPLENSISVDLGNFDLHFFRTRIRNFEGRLNLGNHLQNGNGYLGYVVGKGRSRAKFERSIQCLLVQP